MAQLAFITKDGIAELSDGTRWCIAYDQLPQTQGWQKGADISVALQPRGTVWPYTLTYRPTGEAVSASAPRGQAPQCALNAVRVPQSRQDRHVRALDSKGGR